MTAPTDDIATDALDWSVPAHRHELLRRIADEKGEWSGIPMMLDSHELVIEDRHPFKLPLSVLSGHGVPDDERVRPAPAPEDVDALLAGRPPERREFVCRRVDTEEHIVNSWVDWEHRRRVIITATIDVGGEYDFLIPDEDKRTLCPTKYGVVKMPLNTSADRLSYTLQTLGASFAWDLDAEHRARTKLRELITPPQWHTYDMTGGFVESSPRSRVTYVFRRLRPTVALVPRNRCDDSSDAAPMRILAVLCMHPIGYYARSWAGCMTPTDDVIAHLLTMRADEAYLWRKANQHVSDTPESGL